MNQRKWTDTTKINGEKGCGALASLIMFPLIEWKRGINGLLKNGISIWQDMLIFFITSSLSFPSQEKPPNAMPKSAWKSISCLFGMALPVTQVLDKGKASYCIDFIFQSCTALCPKHFIDFIFQSCTALCPKHFSTLIQVQIYFQFYSRKAKPISSVYIYIYILTNNKSLRKF